MSAEGGYLSDYLARLADGEPPTASRAVSAVPAAPAAPPEPASAASPASVPASSPAPDVQPPAVASSAAARPASGNGAGNSATEIPPPRQAPAVTAAEAAPAPARAAAPPAGGLSRPLPAGPQARSRAAVERTLARAGFSDAFAGELIDTALAHILPLAPRIGMVPAVRAALAQRVPSAAALPATGGSIVVVGAGGSGKTTCCSALLSAYRTHSTLPARFGTLIRGEQETALKMIMSPQMLEPQPADSPRVRRELRSASSDGAVVIDTPRLSPSEPGTVRELARVLDELEIDRTVVALPVTLGAVAAEQLLASLEPIGPAGVALTHADETDQLGVGIELACRFHVAPELLLEHAPAGGWRLQRLDPAELAARVLR